MTILYAICYSVFESIWRRTQGGGHFKRFYEKFIYPWLRIKSRFFFTTLNLAVAFCMAFFALNLSLWPSLMFVLSVELFWDMSFGMYMDMGRKYPPTENDIKDYNDTPLNFVIDWFFKKDDRYGKTYDSFAMTFRYTWPLIIMPLAGACSWWILLLGPLVSFSYELGWILYERFGFKVDDAPTCLSEYMAGAFAGFLWIIL